MLKNREEAAHLLLKKLMKYRGKKPLVLGIPRGAMPMADIIAKGLAGELNAIMVHKIPAPLQPELAIASVGISGEIYSLPSAQMQNISDDYISKEAARQVLLMEERKKKFQLPELRCRGRIVILVDDGIATGATVQAAIQEIKKENPRMLVLAAGVVPGSTAKQLRQEVDELVVVEEPDIFFSVSQFFNEFDQVTDEDVIKIFQKKVISSGPSERHERPLSQ